MKQRFGLLDHCIFDHLRYFLFATGAPFFVLFFLTRFLGVSSLFLVGIIGMATSFVIVSSTYFAWGRDTLVRHRQTRWALIFTALPCVLLHLAFLIMGWVLIFIVKIHWHFSTVFLFSTLFPPMSALLGVLGIDASYFMDERIVPAYWTVIFFAVALIFCALLAATAVIAYERGVREDEKIEQMAARGEVYVRKTYAKRMRFIPLLNLGSFFPWIIRHMIHPEARMREIIPPILVMLLSGMGYYFLVLFLSTLLQSVIVYYLLIALGVYLLGLFLSFVELIDEKKYDFLD